MVMSNLKEILRRKGITVKDYAEFLGIAEKTAHNKLEGKTEFTLSEAKRTAALFAEYSPTYIFGGARHG